MKYIHGKNYETRDGRPVVIHRVVTHNSAGHSVTFPIKGSIVRRTPTGRERYDYNIWREDGRVSVFEETPDDLVEIKT